MLQQSIQYLIADPAALRPLVSCARLVLTSGHAPFAIVDFMDMTPAVIQSLLASGALRPVDGTAAPSPPTLKKVR